jgi:hypothetical protein
MGTPIFVLYSATMLLFVAKTTPRLQYIVDFIGTQLFNEPIRITNDEHFFRQQPVPKINYSTSPFGPDEFFIQPVALLFEQDIKEQPVHCFTANNQQAFFSTTGDYPFDVLAASFYLLSRYEEYLPHKPDEYGRYAHTNSLAFKEGFLQQPLVNYWLEDFKKALQNKFTALPLKCNRFKFVPTYDIDIAWSYKHKGWTRTAVAMLQYIFKGRWQLLRERIAVLQNKQVDPFDSYEWLDALHLYCKLRPYYFFLMAEKQVGYDRNISPSKKAMQQLIAYQATKGTTGIHPSWQSGNNYKLLKEEIGWLEFITEKDIRYSRQHYIRFTLPHTYRRLIEAGITKEFSMGYGSINGFRASVASSFYWYDLAHETTTSLLLFPFCFMDANSFYEEKQSPAQAFAQLMQLYQAVKKVNGLMITVWHNQFFGTDPLFKGWKEVYEVFIKEEVYWDALY